MRKPKTINSGNTPIENIRLLPIEKKVSVIIPVYNEERRINACIQSLIAQTFPRDDMEWIIVDGASTDKTVEIIRSYQTDYPITLLENPKRKTPISLNMAILNARGAYIIRLDAHAEYPRNYIEKCVYYLEHIDADNVGGYFVTKGVGLMGTAIAEMLSSPFGVGNAKFRIEGQSGYVDTVPFGAFRKDVFQRVGLFNETLLRSEDNDFNERIRLDGGKIYLAEDIHLIYYCRNDIPSLLRMGVQNGKALFQTIAVNPSAMKFRHFVPFLFLLSLILLPLIGIWFHPALWGLYAELAAYFLLDLFFSFQRRNFKTAFFKIWLFPLFHLSYGLGSLRGLPFLISGSFHKKVNL